MDKNNLGTVYALLGERCDSETRHTYLCSLENEELVPQIEILGESGRFYSYYEGLHWILTKTDDGPLLRSFDNDFNLINQWNLDIPLSTIHAAKIINGKLIYVHNISGIVAINRIDIYSGIVEQQESVNPLTFAFPENQTFIEVEDNGMCRVGLACDRIMLFDPMNLTNTSFQALPINPETLEHYNPCLGNGLDVMASSSLDGISCLAVSGANEEWYTFYFDENGNIPYWVPHVFEASHVICASHDNSAGDRWMLWLKTEYNDQGETNEDLVFNQLNPDGDVIWSQTRETPAESEGIYSLFISDDAWYLFGYSISDSNNPVYTSEVIEASMNGFPTSINNIENEFKLINTVDEIGVQSHEIFEIQLLDINGRIIRKGSSNERWSKLSFNKGMYFLRASNGDQLKTWKISN